jgi:DnaD/phage-associated family protein
MNHAQDGSLGRYTADDIADACDWLDDAQTFYNALIQSGFIDESEQGYIIHDWFDYAGKLIALRQKDAERKRNSRGKKNESESSPEDIHRTSNGGSTESIRDLNPNLNLNKDLKENTSTSVYVIYQNSIGMMNGTVKQMIDDDISLYTELWVEDAIKEAVRQNKNSYSYIQGILKKWKRDGRGQSVVTAIPFKQEPKEKEVQPYFGRSS